MPETFESEVAVTDLQENTTVLLDGNNSRIFAVGNSKIVLNANLGTLSLHNNSDDGFGDNPRTATIRASAEDSTLFLQNPQPAAQDNPIIQLKGAEGTVAIGGIGTSGNLGLFSDGFFDNPDNLSNATIHANGKKSFIQLRNSARENTIFIDGQESTMFLGDNIQLNGENGDLFSQSIQLRNAAGDNTVFLGGENGTILLGDNFQIDGENSSLISQSIQLRDAAGDNTVFLGGENSTILLGDNLQLDGGNSSLISQSIQLRDAAGNNTIFMGGNDGLVLGQRFRLSSALRLGANGDDGDISLFRGTNTSIENPSEEASIRLNGDTGDIILQNADCAEDFEVEILEIAEPGTVMVISNDSRLRVSDQPYDQRVAGIVAGAGKYRPGLILGRKKGETNHLPIALMGRVFCKVDADQGAIRVGDLLTTSPTSGYAMKADDPARAFGAVIGKALDQMHAGQGLIPVLVTLQ